MRMENADEKMRMIKCGWQNADDKMRMLKFGHKKNTLHIKRITSKRSDDSLTSDVTEMLNF